MSLMKSDRTKAPKSDRIAGYAITPATAVISSASAEIIVKRERGGALRGDSSNRVGRSSFHGRS